jgi:hypothetical protein
MRVGVTTAVLLVACRDDPSASAGPPASDAGADVDERYSFRVESFSRDCATDEDCILLIEISQCSTCWCTSPVRRGDAEAAFAAVREACRQPGAPPSGGCGIGCGQPRAACFERICVQLYGDAGG